MNTRTLRRVLAVALALAGPLTSSASTWTHTDAACPGYALTGTVGNYAIACPGAPVAVPPVAIACPQCGELWSKAVGETLYVSSTGAAPALVSAGLRRIHGSAGPFDLGLSLDPAAPSIDPRQGDSATVLLTFDVPLAAATATVTEGAAVADVATVSGATVSVPLSGLVNGRYVTVAVSGVVPSGGGNAASATVRVGLLAGDVNGNRIVTVADLLAVNAALASPVAADNFRLDVNLSGSLTVGDLLGVNAQLSQGLPAP